MPTTPCPPPARKRPSHEAPFSSGPGPPRAAIRGGRRSAVLNFVPPLLPPRLGSAWKHVKPGRTARHERDRDPIGLSASTRRSARSAPEPLALAREVATGDPALLPPVLPVDRVRAADRGLLFRDSLRGPLPTRHL